MMKKLALVLICIFALSLAACGGRQAPPASTPANPAASAPVDGPDYGPYSQESPLVLKGVSYGVGVNNTMNRANLMMAEVLNEISDGVIVVDVYNDGTLADNDRTALEGLLLGNWDLSYNNTAQMSNYVKEYGIFDMLYLFRSMEHAHAFLNSDVYDDIEEWMIPNGVRTLAMDITGFRNTYVNAKQKPIHTADDLKGVMLRVNDSELFIQGFRALGASPIAMPNSEIVPALQQGTVDGLDQGSIIMVSSGYAEFVKYGGRTEHSVQFVTYNIRESLFQSLTPDLQNLIREGAREAARRRSESNASEIEKFEEEMISKGIEINEVDKDSFINQLDDYYGTYVPAFGDLYDRITALIS